MRPFTYVPIPPFHSTSTGARRMALTNSLGVNVARSAPRTAWACGLISMDFNDRGYTPPPDDSSAGS